MAVAWTTMYLLFVLGERWLFPDLDHGPILATDDDPVGIVLLIGLAALAAAGVLFFPSTGRTRLRAALIVAGAMATALFASGWYGTGIVLAPLQVVLIVAAAIHVRQVTS